MAPKGEEKCLLREASPFSRRELEVASEPASLPKLLARGHVSLHYHPLQRELAPTSPHGDWQPGCLPGLSVPSSRGHWLSRGSAGFRNPSHALHQSPQMACSVEHTVMEGGIRKGRKPPGAMRHQIICPSFLILPQNVLLSISIETAKEAFDAWTRGTLVSTNPFPLIKPPSSLWLSWKALER